MKTTGFFAPRNAFLLGLMAAALTAPAARAGWQVLDRVVLPPGLQVEGMTVGGLSGAAYDPKTKLLWTVSDGRQWPQSMVFQFRLQVDAVTGKMRLEPRGVLALQVPGYPGEPLDAEGLALWTRDRFFVSHEGSKRGALAPGIACFSGKTGRALFGIPVPEEFLSTAAQPERGVQENRGFESVCLSLPRATYLFTANESPLLQDLANPRDSMSGPVRILRYRLSRLKEPPVQRAYQADRDALFGSVVEMLSVPGTDKLLVLERQLTWPVAPRQRRIRIYEVDFLQDDATDISGLASLRGKKITPLQKRLVFDSSRDGLRGPDNLEGMTWGPEVRGQPTLLLVSDDNFSASQHTEFVLLGRAD
jgi:hypothetical protein